MSGLSASRRLRDLRFFAGSFEIVEGAGQEHEHEQQPGNAPEYPPERTTGGRIAVGTRIPAQSAQPERSEGAPVQTR